VPEHSAEEIIWT